ncbi:hypothetical protein Tco_1203225 [Tanacetum coccineum]
MAILTTSKVNHTGMQHIFQLLYSPLALTIRLRVTKTADNASKSLDKLIGSQITNKSRKGVGFVSYNVVPPPHTGLFSPPNLDLSYSGLEEFQQPEFEGYGPKTSKSVSEDISNEVRESPDAPLVEELVSDDKLEKKTVFPTVAKIEFVRPKQQEKPVRKPVKPKAVNTARPNSAVVNVVRANQVNAVKASACWGHPQKEDQGYVDSGCSRHMTWNMSYLSDFKDFNGEIELTTTIDGTVKTGTETSVRRHLQLADADGISSLPTTKIFEQLSLMGVKGDAILLLALLQSRAQLGFKRLSKQSNDSPLLRKVESLETDLKNGQAKYGVLITRLSQKGENVGEKIARSCQARNKEVDELSYEELQQMMIIVPEQGMNVEALQTKYVIIDWEIYTEGTRKYWKIIKVGNHIEKFNSTEPTDDKEREIWVELYDSCGVHHVYTEEGIDIYILVEKEYPLSRGTLTLILATKLLVDQDNKMSIELLRKIFMQA